MKVVGGRSQILLLCVPHLWQQCFVTQSAGWPFNTWDREEASSYLLVAKGWRRKQGPGVRGTVPRSVEASGNCTASLQASLRSGLGQGPWVRCRRGVASQAAWVSCPLPAPACPAGELGCQRPLCLCKQSGLGLWPGLTQRSDSSALGWQRLGLSLAEGTVGAGARRAQCVSQVTPVLPGLCSLDFLAPRIGLDSSWGPPAPLWARPLPGVLAWLGRKCQYGESRENFALGAFCLDSPAPVVVFF